MKDVVRSCLCVTCQLIVLSTFFVPAFAHMNHSQILIPNLYYAPSPFQAPALAALHKSVSILPSIITCIGIWYTTVVLLYGLCKPLGPLFIILFIWLMGSTFIYVATLFPVSSTSICCNEAT